MVARALMENYTVLPNGFPFPQTIRLQWPDVDMEIRLDIRNPEVNPTSLAQLWQVPHYAPAVDLGELARRSRSPSPVSPVRHQQPLEPAVRRNESVEPVELAAPLPAARPAPIPTEKTSQPPDEGLPPWARGMQ